MRLPARTAPATLLALAALAPSSLAQTAASPPEPAAPAPALRHVPAAWFSCSDGKYAVTLSRHYRSLFKIGRHRVVEIGTQRDGPTTWSRRRIEYIGLTLEVKVNADEPERYELTRLEAWSRRWNIGRLSVGQKPWWWWFGERSLKGVPLQGVVQLDGTGESATLWLDDGRIDRVSLRCRA